VIVITVIVITVIVITEFDFITAYLNGLCGITLNEVGLTDLPTDERLEDKGCGTSNFRFFRFGFGNAFCDLKLI
jgi:hypothetical protein